MKRVLFITLLVGCFTVISFGSTPVLQKSFGASKYTWNTSKFIQSLRMDDLCDYSSPPPPSNATMTPECTDISDGNSNSDEPVYGQTQKGANLIQLEANPIVKISKQIEWSPETFEFVEEHPLAESAIKNNGLGFDSRLPVVDLYANDFATYRFEVVHRNEGVDFSVMVGYVKVYYPGFWILT